MTECLPPLQCIGAIALLVFIGHSQLQAAKAQVFFEDSIKQSRTLEKLSRQNLSQIAALCGNPRFGRLDPSPDEAHNEQDVLHRALEARINSLEKTVALQPDHTQAWADLAFCKLEHFGLTRRIAGETIGLTEIRQTVEQTEFESAEARTAWVQKIAGDGFRDLTQAL